MRLLVSVSDADEARAAIVGGAHIIDAKDPFQGALGAVTAAALQAIVSAAAGARPVSAALGDVGNDAASDPGTGTDRWERLGRDLAFVKLGFASRVGRQRAGELAAAAVEAVRATACRVVLAAYADGGSDQLSREAVLDVAVESGAAGVLLDTSDKGGPPLFSILERDAVAAWVAAAHSGGLFVALAGSLRLADLATVGALGADVVGVRGAACDGGRTGRVSTACVRALVDSLGRSQPQDFDSLLHGHHSPRSNVSAHPWEQPFRPTT